MTVFCSFFVGYIIIIILTLPTKRAHPLAVSWWRPWWTVSECRVVLAGCWSAQTCNRVHLVPACWYWSCRKRKCKWSRLDNVFIITHVPFIWDFPKKYLSSLKSHNFKKRICHSCINRPGLYHLSFMYKPTRTISFVIPVWTGQDCIICHSCMNRPGLYHLSFLYEPARTISFVIPVWTGQDYIICHSCMNRPGLYHLSFLYEPARTISFVIPVWTGQDYIICHSCINRPGLYHLSFLYEPARTISFVIPVWTGQDYIICHSCMNRPGLYHLSFLYEPARTISFVIPV